LDAGEDRGSDASALRLQGAKAKRFVKTALELQAAPDEVKEAVAHGVEGLK